MIPRLRAAVGGKTLVDAVRARHTVADFERAFANLMQQDHGIAFPYGRTALMMLFEALGLTDCNIILPAYTCVVVAHAIVLTGNRPVFIDSEPGGFNMDLVKAEAAITPRTGAILATSIHGYPVDLDQLDALQARHPRIAIIQDCAHSFSASWKGRPVQKAGVAAIYGLNVSKLMTSVFGGMVTTNNLELAGRLKDVRAKRLSGGGKPDLRRAAYLAASTLALSPPVFGMVRKIADLGLIDRFVRYFDEGLIDMPADHLQQIGNTEASVGVRQCAAYPGIIERRRATAAFYDEALKDIFPTGRPPLVEGATYSHYVVRTKDPVELVRLALDAGLELGRVIDYCVPEMPAYREITLDQGPFDETRKLNASVVNIPIWVDQRGAEKIADILRKLPR